MSERSLTLRADSYATLCTQLKQREMCARSITEGDHMDYLRAACSFKNIQKWEPCPFLAAILAYFKDTNQYNNNMLALLPCIVHCAHCVSTSSPVRMDLLEEDR